MAAVVNTAGHSNKPSPVFAKKGVYQAVAKRCSGVMAIILFKAQRLCYQPILVLITSVETTGNILMLDVSGAVSIVTRL